MSRSTLLFCATALALVAPTILLAQTAVERNLPPAVAPSGGTVVSPEIASGSEDDTPLGATLRGVVLLGNDDAVVTDVPEGGGVNAARVPMLDDPALVAALNAFIGQPISRKLIGDIQARIAREARAHGRPFVSLSTPEQEITSGVLQIRVSEFRAGQIDVQGVDGAAARAVENGVRLESGGTIDTHRLAEDLDWLNRNPFTEIAARFSPSEGQTGKTDLTLSVRHDKPVRVYGGWSNGGSTSTGIHRFFVGIMSRLPFIDGAYASYQLTGSKDFWYDDGQVLAKEPRYVAQGARIYVPIVSRQNVEVTLSDALTNQAINRDFSVRQRTSEASIAYRSALSNLGLPDGAGDVVAGVEFKRQSRKVFFGELTALSDTADIWQLTAGYSKGWLGNGRQAVLGVNLHVNPGGVSKRGSSRRLEEISNGRVTSNEYAYGTLDLSTAFRLPGNFAIANQLSAQYSRKPLPLPTQIGLGGEGLVRGYMSDDGSFDRGMVMRNELRLPPFSLIGRTGKFADLVSPYVFVDAGRGRDIAASRSSTIVSAGVGTEYRIGRNINAGVNSAWALKDGLGTQAGDWRLQARVTATF
ncbi:ShlB/FhaC/HecB family hemolysin secretion/activation protein [Sphingobium sp. B11D3A]|uniref:ShlB/FhaC/HecB family hemolysin secretion/activation protein n=1 Tax=Sphingobium sp. B11D3A TaxID=2940574 RepID=UPI00222414A4|nr:ShlB/FhaC/HecB family hemolysin secretion/activation protein [Sphingobium sp. B11D3A]MCW2393540.1 hemolysin activation/secretion protein [Sphingobium sp. B11D3A]